jgi:hypothetical protein
MDDPHALCLYLFNHVSKPDPTNKMEMMMSSPILPPHIIFFHQLTAIHTSCLHHFTASKTASRILKPCHFCLLLLIVEAGMQLSLLLLLQHSHFIVNPSSGRYKKPANQGSSIITRCWCNRYLLWCVSHPTLLLQHSS